MGCNLDLALSLTRAGCVRACRAFPADPRHSSVDATTLRSKAKDVPLWFHYSGKAKA